MAFQLLKRLFNLEDYHKMAEVGILSEHDRVELMAGVIADKTPIRSRDAACLNHLNQLL